MRNWDYRYCWLRDATLTLLALLHCNHADEAGQWRRWLIRAIAGDPADVQIMYGVAGERRLSEFELPWLDGYEGSQPVRVGNAASEQLQLDVYGEVLDCFYQARQHGLPVDAAGVGDPARPARPSRRGVAGAGRRHLGDPRRAPPLRPLEGDGLGRVRPRGAHRRGARVRRARSTAGARCGTRSIADVCERGFDPELGSFTQSYGSKELDASLLLLPLVGFLPATDPRIRGTIEAVERELLQDGFVLRYRTQRVGVDGLPPGEGVFLPCSFWLCDCYELLGRHDDAHELFGRLVDLGNDLGLMSEEYDPKAERLLGNFPQAFTHLALVNTAFNLAPHLPSPMHRRHATRH